MATRLGLAVRETGEEQRGERKRGKGSMGKQREGWRQTDRHTERVRIPDKEL